MRLLGLGLLCLLQDPSIYTDEARGFSIPIPPGWSVTSTADDVSVLRMTAPGGSGAQLILRIQAPVKELNDGLIRAEDFAVQIRSQLEKKFKDVTMDRLDAGKGAHGPTLLVTFSYSANEKKVRALQYMVSAAEQFYVLTWTAEAEEFPKLEAAFERTSKAFALTKKK